MAAARGVEGERRILVTGGGTGGHVYPALGVLHHLSRRLPRLAVRWVGSERIESRIVKEEGLDFFQIDIRFSYRRLSLANLDYYRRHLLPILTGKPYRQALHALETYRPRLVLGTGGYVSAPALMAAQKAGTPYALLQLDNPPGVVNWTMADKAWRIFASTPEVAAGFAGRCAGSKVLTLGYPCMPGRSTGRRLVEEFEIEPERKVLLVMGGSLGAGAINRAVREMVLIASALDEPCAEKLAIIHVGGERSLEAVPFEDAHALTRGRIAYRPVDYISDVTGLMQSCDFYIGRSGAATVGELISARLPCLLIPDPQHADNQQQYNAEELVRRGLGTMLHQSVASGKALLDWLKSAWDQPRIEKPRASAADLIADELVLAWEDA